MAEEESANEKFKEMTLAESQRREAKIKAMEEGKFNKTQEFNLKIIKYFEEIAKTAGNIGQKSKGWFTRLQQYFVKDFEKRTIGEINALGQNEERVQSLQTDLSLILQGLDAVSGYDSPIIQLSKEVTELKANSDRQKESLENEKRTRKELEEKLKIMDKKIIDVEEDSQRIEKLRGSIDSYFGGSFLTYLLKEISKLSIPGVNFELDEGTEYVLSSDFHALLQEIKKTGTTEKLLEFLTDKKTNELTDKIIQNLSKYMKTPNHANYLNKLTESLLKARKTLKSRTGSKLFWCANYSQRCAFTCPGFKVNETYCPEEKNFQYNSGRLELVLYMMEDAYQTVQRAIEVENLLFDRQLK